ncbi:hypothetical protein PR202_gb09330 [Eleusine coracana subsp. coracana]|uniref:BHLH domain-containing protein n=1 Tax=Eleusine coracana subsp. coracana TaxID=191504 RepID=A0AAV5EH20_ELECO|nr:hypothetical protein PR202_gb09330 [Eleusine coracana subsp. coracana]
MHLHAGGAVQLQYFMPQHHPEAATDLQHSAVRSSSTSPPATMWEYHQAALQSSSSSLSFPSWSPYAAGPTAALLGSAGSTFAADSSSPSFDMRLPASGEHVHSQAWGQHGEQSNNTCYKENFLDLLASKNMTPEMFEDAPPAGHYAAQAPSSGRFGASSDDVSPVKYEMAAGSPLLAGSSSATHQEMNMMSCLPRYAYVDHHHQMKEGSNQQELAAPAMASFLQQLSTNNNASVGLHGGMDYSGVVFDKICQESRGVEASIMRALPYYSSSGGYKPTAESTTAAQPYMRRVDLSQSNKQEQDIVPARSSSTGSGPASDCKKRPSQERTSKVKKSKQEGSKASPPKQQVPKVKIGEKITALQQIVSPFGKTDTASVLFETIKYIKFLHEQVQLLSEPYTNSSRNKLRCMFQGNVPWGDHAAAEASKQGEAVEHDLRDRGLCLVPVSCTPQVYRDGTAMDYWTPAYRGCLYR